MSVFNSLPYLLHFAELWGLDNDLLKVQKKSKKDVAEVLVSELEMVATTTVEKERKRIVDGITL